MKHAAIGLAFIAACWLLAMPALEAQLNTTTGALSTAVCPGTGCVIYPLRINGVGQNSASVQLTGTWTGTVQFDVSVDCSTYVAVNGTPPNSTTAVTSATANGIWTFTTAGMSCLRVWFSTASTGTVNASVLGASVRAGPGGLLSNAQFVSLSGGTMTGALLFTDNSIDIGASGATRPRTGYFGTSVVAPAITLGSSTLCTTTAPTRASGFGTGADASFATGSTACAFDMNIGTGGAPTSGVLTMPAAAHGWICNVRDITTIADNTYESAYTTTSVTFTTTIAWTANDHLFANCLGF